MALDGCEGKTLVMQCKAVSPAQCEAAVAERVSGWGFKTSYVTQDGFCGPAKRGWSRPQKVAQPGPAGKTARASQAMAADGLALCSQAGSSTHLLALYLCTSCRGPLRHTCSSRPAWGHPLGRRICPRCPHQWGTRQRTGRCRVGWGAGGVRWLALLPDSSVRHNECASPLRHAQTHGTGGHALRTVAMSLHRMSVHPLTSGCPSRQRRQIRTAAQRSLQGQRSKGWMGGQANCGNLRCRTGGGRRVGLQMLPASIRVGRCTTQCAWHACTL